MGVPGQTRLYSYYRGIKYSVSSPEMQHGESVSTRLLHQSWHEWRTIGFLFEAERQTVRCFRQPRVSLQPRHIHSLSYAVPKAISLTLTVSPMGGYSHPPNPCRSRVELPNHGPPSATGQGIGLLMRLQRHAIPPTQQGLLTCSSVGSERAGRCKQVNQHTSPRPLIRWPLGPGLSV